MTARQRTRDTFIYVVGVVVVVGIVASFFVTRSEVHDVGSRVTKVESPCLRYGPKSPQCKAAFEAAVATITHPEACAIERKAGTLRAIRELAQGLHVNFKEPCAGARIAQERQRGNERAQAKGGGASTGNSPSSTPGPSTGGSPGGTGLGNSGSDGGSTPGSPGSGGEPASNPPAGPPVGGSANPEGPSPAPESKPPISVAPVVEGVESTVCSVNAAGVRLCP